MTVHETIETKELTVASVWSLKAGTAPTASQTGWAITNKTPNRSVDCDDIADPPANLLDSLGTLVDDLIAKGILSA